jgi:hypothetical protein
VLSENTGSAGLTVKVNVLSAVEPLLFALTVTLAVPTADGVPEIIALLPLWVTVYVPVPPLWLTKL